MILKNVIFNKLKLVYIILPFGILRSPPEFIAIHQHCTNSLCISVLIKAFKRLNASTADIVNTLKQSHVFCAAPAEWKQGDTAAV